MDLIDIYRIFHPKAAECTFPTGFVYDRKSKSLAHFSTDRKGIQKYNTFYLFIFCLLSFVVVVVAISWAAPAAYGGSQARGLIGAVATGLRQSHSNSGSEPHL